MFIIEHSSTVLITEINIKKCVSDKETHFNFEYKSNPAYFARSLLAATVSLDFFLEAVFLCKIPFETALSQSL